MTQDQFFDLFRRYVMHAPSGSFACQRPEAWAVLKNLETDLNDPALGATIRDRDKPTFFSRAWSESGHNPNAIRHRYPILVANIVEVISERTGKKERTDRLIFDLAVLDQVKLPKASSTPCDRRTEIEIFQDCHGILQQVFSYLTECAAASDGTATLYAHPSEIEWLAEENIIEGFTASEPLTRNVQRKFKGMVESAKAYPWRGGISGLYGAYVPELEMEFHVCEEETTLLFTRYDYKITERETY